MKNYFIFGILLLLVGCGGVSAPTGSTSPAVSSETSFCETETSYSPGVAVSGTAKFKRRSTVVATTSSVVTQVTLGAVASTSLPIKYAEIRVLQGGNIVQCGTTNEYGELKGLDGTSSLKIPNDAGTYTIEVYSRAKKVFPSAGKPTSATLYTSVKEDIYSNTVYKISSSFSSNGTGGAANSDVNLIAQASESLSSKIEGGAFNIYNNWVATFEYLLSTSNTGAADVSCLSNKLDMYWKAGFNPYQYVYPDEDPSSLSNVSFYLRDDMELYINGGKLDNVSSADTDHFDDTVILHEIGHHIENACGTMDSPGGTHYAQYRIDPRLAWSEGWGNFLGAHILKNNISKINPDLISSLPNNEWLHYSDTSGYNDTGVTTGTSLILMRMNKPGDGSGVGSDYDTVVPASFPGESHTREASIARGLFKGVNTCNSNCIGGVTFDKYWIALGKTSQGMGISTSPFRSSAKFLSKVYAANSNSFSGAMTTMLTGDEALHMLGSASFSTTAVASSTGTSVAVNSWPPYGIQLTTNNSCDRALIQPRSTTYTYADDSDQRFTNHFYSFKRSDLVGVTQIKLVSDSDCNMVDLDLVVFSDNYSYNEDCTSYATSMGSPYCSGVSKTTSSDVATYARTTSDSETVTISGLGAGYYLLNVRAYSTNPKTISSNAKCVYKLTDQNGSTLCPSTSY